MWRALFACIALCLALAQPVCADQLRLAYLQLNETAPETYDVLWKVPARGESLRLSLSVRLPERCRELTSPRTAIDGGAHSTRWQIHCTEGLSGGRIRVEGLAEAAADALVRIEHQDGTSQVARLVADTPELDVAASPGAVRVATTYLGLGVEHILRGADHLLFVFALLLIVTGTRRLVTTITAFTVAHSITLAAATLGLVRIPIAPVEAVIALSIVFVASEILRVKTPSPPRGEGRGEGGSLTARAPWLVAFTFGLLHGFGFASALGEIGLPQTRIPVALLFFNVGVEVGQLLFVAAVLSVRHSLRGMTARLPQWTARVPPYAIGSVAMFWVIQRIAAF
jgi:hydrogenase/urease accessory protein HupE